MWTRAKETKTQADHATPNSDCDRGCAQEAQKRVRGFGPGVNVGPPFSIRRTASTTLTCSLVTFRSLEYYQELGFRVIGAPTGCSNTSTWRKLPDFPRYGENIHAFSRRIQEAGAMGIVTLAWYPMPPEALLPGIMFTGQFAWNPDVAE